MTSWSSKPDSAACTRRGLRTCSQEQSQCRDASKIGGRRLRCFGRVVKTLHWEGEPQYERLTTSTTVSQLITLIQRYKRKKYLFLPFVTSLRGKLNTLTVILYSCTPYSDRTNKLSKPIVPAR